MLRISSPKCSVKSIQNTHCKLKKKKRKIESNDYNRTSYFETISWKIAKRIVNKKTHVLQLPINTDSYFSQFDSEIAILSRNSTREKFHLEFFPRIHGYCTSISHYTKKKNIYIYTHFSTKNIRQRIRDREGTSF